MPTLWHYSRRQNVIINIKQSQLGPNWQCLKKRKPQPVKARAGIVELIQGSLQFIERQRLRQPGKCRRTNLRQIEHRRNKIRCNSWSKNRQPAPRPTTGKFPMGRKSCLKGERGTVSSQALDFFISTRRSQNLLRNQVIFIVIRSALPRWVLIHCLLVAVRLYVVFGGSPYREPL
jgi:hypothetical protein